MPPPPRRVGGRLGEKADPGGGLDVHQPGVELPLLVPEVVVERVLVGQLVHLPGVMGDSGGGG